MPDNTRPRWHPLLDAAEPEPGVWTLTAQFESQPHTVIELRRTVDGPRFRVQVRGELIGWATTLRLAIERGYGERIRQHGPRGQARADWGIPAATQPRR